MLLLSTVDNSALKYAIAVEEIYALKFVLLSTENSIALKSVLLSRPTEDSSAVNVFLLSFIDQSTKMCCCCLP